MSLLFFLDAICKTDWVIKTGIILNKNPIFCANEYFPNSLLLTKNERIKQTKTSTPKRRTTARIFEIFGRIRPYLEKIDNIHALETPLYSDHLEVAGTVDCIAEYEGKLSVIDFKTSSKPKTRDHIHGYFMQTAAYAVAFEELTGIPVGRLVIIMGIDDNPTKIFVEKRDDWIDGFKSLRLEYKSKHGI